MARRLQPANSDAGSTIPSDNAQLLWTCTGDPVAQRSMRPLQATKWDPGHPIRAMNRDPSTAGSCHSP